MRIVLAFAINTLFNFIVGLTVAKFLGPDEYGRFALAVQAAMVIQTLLFDWVKLSATRFYSERARTHDPALRATLETMFAFLAVLLIMLALVLLRTGVHLELGGPLVALALLASITNGMFDFHTAMMRARFMDRDYFRLVFTKNIAALCLTVGGAFFFHSAPMALAGACLSIGGSVFTVRRRLHDALSPPSAFSAPSARKTLTYAVPIVAANFLYHFVPLFNRAVITHRYGFAETGQFSLASDVGLRVVSAIGSALDVLLFQLAVAADENHGLAEGKAQIARNMVIVFALVAPACMGLWLILPSFDHLVVPAQFAIPFGYFITLLLPGLFCHALINYAINPVFQLARRTWPLIGAAAVGAAFNVIVVSFGPVGTDATLIAEAQGSMFIVALVVLLGIAAFTRPQWPLLRDLAKPALGVAAMTAVLLPMRHWQPSLVTLLAQVLVGAFIYALAIIIFDIGGMRGTFLSKWRKRFKQPVLASDKP